jgi:uncharacterized membrane protein
MKSEFKKQPEQPEKLQPGTKLSNTIIPTAPLPDPISQNIEAIIALQNKADKEFSQHHRIVEGITTFWSRPTFLYSTVIVVSLWIVYDFLPSKFGLPKFDSPTLDYLDITLGFGSLLMTIGILITQRRQEKLAEQRAQLSLQLNLLSEQKIAKIIALLEELRYDLPNVKNRLDVEAEVMKQATDPEAVVAALEESLAEELAELEKQENLELTQNQTL